MAASASAMRWPGTPSRLHLLCFSSDKSVVQSGQGVLICRPTERVRCLAGVATSLVCQTQAVHRIRILLVPLTQFRDRPGEVFSLQRNGPQELVRQTELAVVLFSSRSLEECRGVELGRFGVMGGNSDSPEIVVMHQSRVFLHLTRQIG